MYSEKLAQIKTTFDQKTILAVSNAETENALRKIIEKYRINISTAEEVFSILMLLCYGIIGTNECFNIINKMNVVEADSFANFITDINIGILNPIQETMKKQVVESLNNTQTMYDDKLINPTPTIVENKIVAQKEVQDIFDDAEEDTDETAEQILARIDKEVDAEIEAEVRAELAMEAEQKAKAEQKNAITTKPNSNTAPDTVDDFIVAKAHGQIASTIEKTTDTNTNTDTQKSQTYMRDPYHEEL